MQDGDIRRFAAVIATLSECFDKEISEKKLEVYFEALKELSIEQVEIAASWIMRHRTITGTFPLISEFYQALDQAGGHGYIDDQAEIAWRKLLWAIENQGYYASVCFDDQVIHDVVEGLGGWMKIAGDNPDWCVKELKWRQKDFVALYRAIARRNGGTSAKPYLVGFFEADNAGRYDEYIPALVKICGDPGKIIAMPCPHPLELPYTIDRKLIDKQTITPTNLVEEP